MRFRILTVTLITAIALGGCVWLKETVGIETLPPPQSAAEAVYMARGQYVAVLKGVNGACPAVTETGPCTRANLATVHSLATNADRLLDKAELIVRDPDTATGPDAQQAANEAVAAVHTLDNAAP